MHENRRLRELLAAHGIPCDLASPGSSYNATMPSYTGSSTGGSATGSFARQDSNTTSYSPTPLNGQQAQRFHSTPGQQTTGAAQMQQGRLDYDQLGLDFILAYDSRGRAAYPSPPPGQ